VSKTKTLTLQDLLFNNCVVLSCADHQLFCPLTCVPM